ncbi:MAG: hypothetical protein KC546_14675 [Anaerolineae bacterium]|nr:hypothetical protein [Anaerolineae bacterium]
MMVNPADVSHQIERTQRELNNMVTRSHETMSRVNEMAEQAKVVLANRVREAQERLQKAEQAFEAAKEAVEDAKHAVTEAEEARAEARRALAQARASASRVSDDKDERKAARDALDSCKRHMDSAERAVGQAHAAVKAAEKQVKAAYEAVQQAKQELRSAIGQEKAFAEQAEAHRVQVEATHHALENDNRRAQAYLNKRRAALEKFDSVTSRLPYGFAHQTKGSISHGAGQQSVIESNARAIIALATWLPQLLGGKHGSLYQRERQKYLRGLIDDPDQPRHVRGWVAQELNRLEQIRSARKNGQHPPGGSKRQVRGIPGIDVGHRYPDIDLAENFRLELASMNRARPQIAKRLGMDDRFR